MRRHIEVNGVTSLMGQDDEDKQQAKTDCRHHKEIIATNCPAWFSRKVRHVCEGDLRSRTMYLATVA